MSVEYRDVTQCEQLSKLPDGAYVVVVDNGDMKLISKENAKFGGSVITTYEVVESASTQNAVDTGIAVQSDNPDPILQKPDGSVPTVWEVYEALNNGCVVLYVNKDAVEGRCKEYFLVFHYYVEYTRGTPVYIELYANGDNVLRMGKTIEQ